MEQQPTTSLPIVQSVSTLLTTQTFGRSIRGYTSVSSTNTLAASWAAQNAPEGSVVLAEYQTAGRGRMGRTWSAARGKNLTFSVILRPRMMPDRLGLLTLTAALAVAEAVDQFTTPIRSEIKWPNDLLLEGRKCSGMLLESSSAGTPPYTVVLGIGLNVNQDDFPAELSDKVTSLLLATGRLTDRAPLLATILSCLERRYRRLPHEAGLIVSELKERLALVGSQVSFQLSSTPETITGILEGITESGSLVLHTEAGPRTFHAGEITTQPIR